MRGAASLVLILGLLLAGCAGSDPATKADPSAAPAQDDDTGSLQGYVVDDEQVPLAGANITLLPEAKQTESGPDGSFKFPDLNPALYTLVATKAGFANASKQIEVRAGTVARLKLILTANPVAEPYTSVHTGSIYLHFAYKDLHRFTALDGAACDPCEFWWRTQPGVSDGRFEVRWTPSVTASAVNQAFRFGLSVNSNNGSYHGLDYIAGGDPIWSGVLKSREGYPFEAHDARKFPANETITMVHADTPDDMNLGLLQRIELWLTLAYNLTLAEDYTILPSP